MKKIRAIALMSLTLALPVVAAIPGSTVSENGVLPICPVRAREFTVNDYVQDGLIAIWDGPDPDARTFPLLYDSSHLAIANGWLTNITASTRYAEAAASRIPDIVDAYHSGEITLEIVARWNRIPNSNSFIRLDGSKAQMLAIHGYAGPILYVRDGVASATAYASYYDPPLTDVFYAANAISVAAGYVYLCCNGQLGNKRISIANPEAAFANATVSKLNIGFAATTAIGCIRYYSRALTAEEMAWNYLIDKRRFNLQ